MARKTKLADKLNSSRPHFSERMSQFPTSGAAAKFEPPTPTPAITDEFLESLRHIVEKELQVHITSVSDNQLRAILNAVATARYRADMVQRLEDMQILRDGVWYKYREVPVNSE